MSSINSKMECNILINIVALKKIKNKYNLFKLEKKISNYYIKNMIATMIIIKDTKYKYRIKLDQIKKLVISKNTSNASNN